MDIDLQACVGGDKHAWDAFVDRCSPVIYAAVQRTMGRHRGRVERADLEDVVQDIFVRLVKDDFRLLRTFDPQRASMSTWLTVVSRSVTIDRLRARRPDPVPLQDQVDRARDEPADPEPAGPEIPLHLLTTRQRLVLRMLFDQEKSVEEIAVMLGVNAQTVRSTKHKALSRLRDHLSAERPQAGPGG